MTFARIFVLALLSFGTIAQPIRFQHFSVEDGLSNSQVYSVLQDKQGYLWAGTDNGLNCYDGYSFKVYHHDPTDSTSITGYPIYCLFEDRAGYLWIGTAGGGLDRFDPSTKSFEHFINDPSNLNSLSDNYVQSIFQDNAGSLWVGTKRGLNKFHLATKTFERFTTEHKKSVMSIVQGADDFLWLGSFGGGLQKFHFSTKEFENFGHDPANLNSLSNDNITFICKDRLGALWIGTDSGEVDKFNPSTKTFQHFNHNPLNPSSLSPGSVSSIYQDRSGALWIGTFGGLNKFDPKTKSFEHFKRDPANPSSLSDDLVYCIYQDRSGILWMGSYNGLNMYNTQAKPFEHFTNVPYNKNSLSNSFVTAIYQDQAGPLWIATGGGGLNKFNPKTKSFEHFVNSANPKSLNDNYVNCVYQDKSGTLWVGTDGGGLDKFNQKARSFRHFRHNPSDTTSISNNVIYSIYEDGSGTLWVGTFDGLNKFNPKTNTFEHFKHDSKNPGSISNDFVNFVFQDRAGIFWISPFGHGLNKFDPITKTFEKFIHYPNNPRSLSHNGIFYVHQDRSGSLWIGTNGGGLNKFDPATKSFTSFTMKNGLPNDCVQAILEDTHGNLWLSTNKGLCKFNPRTFTCHNYDVTDGLQGNTFISNSAQLGANGKFYFGGSSGFNAFFPDSIKDNAYIPPVVITDFKVFEKSMNYGLTPRDIELTYDQDFFSFEFSTLNFIQPQKNQYAYQLVGFDKDWIYSGTRRYASYTNLNPGTYFFRVKGSNNNGVWNEEGIKIKVVILPPRWMTWWFRGIVIVLSGTLITAIYLVRTANIRRTNKRLTATVELRTRELQEKNEEIATQNEELIQHQEEIIAQREQLALQNENLETEVAKRTLELTVQNQQLEQFAFIASHNLRGPVARMLGLGKLLSAGAIAENETKFVMDKMLENTHELDTVVLDLAHILEIRNANLMPAETDLASDLSLAQNTLAKEMLVSGARLVTDFTHGGRVVTIQAYIQSIFLILLDNAIKYRDPSRPLEIQVATRIDGKNFIIRFSDNGLGIDLGLHGSKLFNLYSRFHPEVEGKGVGLFLVKTQLEAMGGSISVESVLNTGITFSIFLKKDG
jgi:ligand-binding sensor domain-containing protein/signal transduction histidine kinase